MKKYDYKIEIKNLNTGTMVEREFIKEGWDAITSALENEIAMYGKDCEEGEPLYNEAETETLDDLNRMFYYAD